VPFEKVLEIEIDVESKIPTHLCNIHVALLDKSEAYWSIVHAV